MKKEILEELKDNLEKKRKAIIERLDSIGHPTEGAETNYDADFPDYGDSAEDNATEVADYTQKLSAEKELEADLKKVDAALKRMEKGEYGKCYNCGEYISIDRLRVMPEADYCVKCK